MPTIVLGNNTGDTDSGLYLVELNQPDPDLSFYGDDFARLRGNARPILLPAGLLDLLAGATITAAVLSCFRKSTANGSDSTVTLNPVLRTATVASQVTWNSYNTGNAWGTPGATGAADTAASVQTWVISDATPDAYRDLTLNAGAIAVLQDILDGGATYAGFLILFDAGHEFDPQVTFDTAVASADGTRPYLTITYTAGGSSVFNPLSGRGGAAAQPLAG